MINYTDVVTDSTLDGWVLRLFFGLFNLSMMFILMNLFLSIWNDAFATVSDDTLLQGFDQELSDHLSATITRWLTSCVNPRQEAVTLEHTVVKVDGLDEIILGKKLEETHIGPKQSIVSASEEHFHRKGRYSLIMKWNLEFVLSSLLLPVVRA